MEAVGGVPRRNRPPISQNNICLDTRTIGEFTLDAKEGVTSLSLYVPHLPSLPFPSKKWGPSLERDEKRQYFLVVGAGDPGAP